MSDKIKNIYNELHKTKSPESHKPDDSGSERSVSNPDVGPNSTFTYPYG